MDLGEYKVSIWGGEAGHYTERFDILVAADSKEFARERAFATAAALYGLLGIEPRPLTLHKTFTYPLRARVTYDDEILAIELGRF